MSRRRLPDLRRLRSLQRLLDRGIAAGGDVDELLHLLKQGMHLLGAVVDVGWGYSGGPRQLGVPSGFQKAYGAHANNDPARAYLSRSPVGSWYVYARDCPPSFQRGEMGACVDRYFADAALVQVAPPGDERVTVVLYRERRERRFDEGDRSLLDLLSPLLARGLGAPRVRHALTAASSETLDDVLDAADGSAVLVFPSREVRWSPRARALWTECLDIDGSSHGLFRVERMLVEAALIADATGASRSPRLPGGVRAHFIRVRPRAGEHHRCLALLYREPHDFGSGRPRVPAEHLLSPRQVQIARLVASGLSLNAAADRLGLKSETARAHLTSAYRRLGVRGRAELAAILAPR